MEIHSESAPGPVFGYAVSNLFHRLAGPNAVRDHPSMATWSCQGSRRAALVGAVVVLAGLAVLAADRPSCIPALELTITNFTCA